jgi:hypothetical protein
MKTSKVSAQPLTAYELAQLRSNPEAVLANRGYKPCEVKIGTAKAITYKP